MVSNFKKALESKDFVVTCEVAPPKGINLEKTIHHIKLLKDKVDAINLTDHQSSVMRFPSLGAALLVKELGGVPILQMTCRDRNRLAPQLIKFEKKIEAGAEFIQTQAVYDLDKLAEFMQYARQFPVKILAGIILLTSAPMARFMNKNIAGVNVPQHLIDEMASAAKGGALVKGIEIAGRMIKQIHEGKICDGVHIMAIGKENLVPDIMRVAGLGGDFRP